MEDYRLQQTGAEVQEILNTSTPQADLTAETERAQEAESALGGRIDDEELRAKAAEEQNAGAIHDEELRAKAAEEINANAIASINEKIPSAASSENKLADVDFVNSSIATATATYRGSYNLVSDLHLAIDATHAQIETLLGTVISVADKNDYCYVQIPTSAETPTQIASVELYKFTDEGWKFGYVLNNSGFTAAQWAALNSAITSGLVAKLNALPTNEELAALLGAKQDVLTFDAVPVEGSNNPVKSGGVHSAIDDEKTARVNNVNTLQGEIDGIEGKIPTGASSDNKLVDTATMNSSISTATATYRGDFNLVSDLHLAVDATHAQIATMLASEIATADNNDYCYVQIPTSAETPTQIAKVERYKYNGSAWGYEYDLNNSGFTASQWAALNSMITSGLVSKLSALPTNQELTAALAAKQDVLTFDNTPTENSTNPVTSGGVYAADKALSDAIEAILLLIPSAATQLNKLVDVAQMNSSISTATATYRGSYNLVSDLSLTIDATEQQIATALAATISTADNNDYAFVQVPTSSETPTQIARTDRYKYNGSVWAFEYTLNTSGFTAAQWAAINSGITTVLVAKLSALPTNSELTSALGLLNDGISAINLKIPATASQSNKLIDAAGLNETLALALGAIDATFNVQSTDGHVTLHITQVDGEITSVQVQSTDIASAAALALKASQADLTALASRVTTAEGNITGLTTRMGTAETNIANLQQLYNDLQQSKPVPVTSLPSTGQQQGVIYRLAGTTSYSDYMWDGSTWVLMATYNNAIDDEPTPGSDNLVKSGGVYSYAKNYKGVLAASTDNIDVIYSESTYLLNTTLVSGTLPSGVTTYAMLTTYGGGNFTYQILTEVYTSANCRTWIRSRYDANTYLAWVESSWNNLDNGIINASDNIDTLSKSGGYVIPTGITIPGTFPNGYDNSVIGNLFVQANGLNLWSQTLFNGGNCWVRNYNTSWVRLLNSNVPILYNDENIDSLKMFGTYLLNTTLVSGTLPFNISTYAILNIYGLDNFCIQTLTQCTQSQEPITWIRSYNNSWTPWSFLTNNSVPIDPSQPLYGKKIVFFGDSVTEGGAAGPQGQINNYPQFVAARTGATITNVGIGGTQMANHVAAPDYNPFSFCNLVTAITTNTWTTQDEKAPVIGKTTQLAALKALDLSTYDYCVIAYGQNDRSNGVAVGNSDSVDNDEFYGAMNNSINALLTAYPNLHIIMVAPYNRVDAPLSNPMLPFVNAVVEEADKWSMPAINLYKISGINAKTVGTYLEDGLHPKLNSKYGYEFFGNLIAAQMLSFV